MRNLKATLLFVHNVAKKVIYKNIKAIVRLPEGYTDFCDIVTGVLQGDTLALSLCIICLDYVLWTWIDLMKEKAFTHKKKTTKKQSADDICI